MTTQKDISYLYALIEATRQEFIHYTELMMQRSNLKVSPLELQALRSLEERKLLNMQQLAEYLRITRVDATRLAMRLVKNKLCIISQDNYDERHKLLSLSPHGSQIMHELASVSYQYLQNVIAKSALHEQRAILEGLSHCAKAMKHTRLMAECSLSQTNEADTPLLVKFVKLIRAEAGYNSAQHITRRAIKAFGLLQKKVCSTPGFMIQHQKKIIAYINYSALTDSKTSCMIQGLYVSIPFRHAGLGTLLIERIAANAQAQGFINCYVKINSEEEAHFYTQCGFKPTKKVPASLQRTNTQWYSREVAP